MRRPFLFLATFVFILGFCGYYLGNRMMSASPLMATHPFVVWSGIFLFLGLVLLGPLMSRVLPENYSGRFFIFRWIVNMTMAIFFALLFYTLVVDLSVFLLGFVIPVEQLHPLHVPLHVPLHAPLHVFLHDWSLEIIALLVGGTFLVGAFQALVPQVYRVDVPIANLPPEFIGFKIAQISDLHIGEMIGVGYVKTVVAKTNALEADAVALTGDIIDGNPRLTAKVTPELAELKSANGTFYVTGNHEYYWGVHKLLDQIHKTGAKILMNEHVVIRRGEAQIAIAGVPDISTNGGMTPG